MDMATLGEERAAAIEERFVSQLEDNGHPIGLNAGILLGCLDDALADAAPDATDEWIAARAFELLQPST